MTIDPARVAFFIPGGLKKFKQKLFDGVGRHIEGQGGKVVRTDAGKLDRLPDDIIPIVGCMPEVIPLIAAWRARGRKWIYWDRGYCRRIFATDLPPGENGGYYRWHLESYQMTAIRDVPPDRWAALKTPVWPWQRTGRHVVVAAVDEGYERFHRAEGWTEQTVARLKAITDRPIVVRYKAQQTSGERLLREDLKGAHCLVTHASGAAVEAVFMGCPVFVDNSSAAALVGRCDIGRIEEPIYPDRDPWLRSLAYSQFNEAELVDGTLWRLLV